MKTCILIGGGNTTNKEEPYETEIIDKEIVSLVKKEEPVFLFIGLASSHSDSKYDNIKKIFQSLGCKTEYLKKKNIIHNPDIVQNKIERADIIYIGGGDTIKLKEEVIENGIDNLLRKAYEKGTILVGKSAGAILLCKEGFSDSYIMRGESDHYQFVEGLGFETITICPHYKENERKQEELIEKIKKKKPVVYGIENGIALKVTNHKIEVIKSIKKNNAYKCQYKNKFLEENL